MKSRALALAMTLAVTGTAHGAIIETVHFANQPTGGIVSFGWEVVQSATREALILDALLEWDNVVCTERFFLFEYLTGTIKIKWEDLGALPNAPLALGGTNSITINSNPSVNWYEGFLTPGNDQLDLLTTLKHEIGHAIGVVGDWGRVDADGTGEDFTDSNGNGSRDPGEDYYDTNLNGRYDPDYTPPFYASSDQLMWGYLDPGTTIRNIQYCDARELEPAYTVHIPEPAGSAFALGGLAYALLRRRPT